jgi:hypothetical protein
MNFVQVGLLGENSPGKKKANVTGKTFLGNKANVTGSVTQIERCPYGVSAGVTRSWR